MAIDGNHEQSEGGKSTVTAYLLWFFLGGFAAHRIYLKRYTSALKFEAIHIAGWVIVFLGGIPNFHPPEAIRMVEAGGFEFPLFYIGGLLVMACLAWLLVDAVAIPSMIADLDRADREEQSYSVPVDFDPSAAGLRRHLQKKAPPRDTAWDDIEIKEDTGPAGLPEDYALPWRKGGDGQGGASYRVQYDETGKLVFDAESRFEALRAAQAEPTAAVSEEVQAYEDEPAYDDAANYDEPTPLEEQILEEFLAEKKGFVTAYACWLFGGVAGIHRWYLGSLLGPVLFGAIWVVGFVLLSQGGNDLAYGSGIVFLVSGVLLFLFDGLTLGKQVTRYNDALLRRIAIEASGA